MRNKIVRIMSIVALILLIPFLAMQFTDELVWDTTDFIVAGVLLFGAGLAYELLTSKMSRTGHRVAVGLVILVVFLLIWAELGVGIFGTPWAGS